MDHDTIKAVVTAPTLVKIVVTTLSSLLHQHSSRYPDFLHADRSSIEPGSTSPKHITSFLTAPASRIILLPSSFENSTSSNNKGSRIDACDWEIEVELTKVYNNSREYEQPCNVPMIFHKPFIRDGLEYPSNIIELIMIHLYINE